jgi:hypothetical protein
VCHVCHEGERKIEKKETEKEDDGRDHGDDKNSLRKSWSSTIFGFCSLSVPKVDTSNIPTYEGFDSPRKKLTCMYTPTNPNKEHENSSYYV